MARGIEIKGKRNQKNRNSKGQRNISHARGLGNHLNRNEMQNGKGPGEQRMEMLSKGKIEI
jgi:hypothetical protein